MSWNWYVPEEPDASAEAPEEELRRTLGYQRRLRWGAAGALGTTLVWILVQLLLGDATLGLAGPGKLYFRVWAAAPIAAAVVAAGLVCLFPKPNWFRALVAYSAMLAWGLPASWRAMQGARDSKVGTKLALYQDQTRSVAQTLQEAERRQDLAGMARSADKYARLMEQSAEAARGTPAEGHYRELAGRTRRMANLGIEKAKLSRALAASVEFRSGTLASAAAIDHGLELLGRYQQVVTEIDGLVAEPGAEGDARSSDRRALGHNVRGLELEQCRAMVAMLTLLRAELGRFALREGQFEFERSDATRQFREQREAYDKATANLRRAQLELVRRRPDAR
jgi:hypothetical protein